VHTSSSEIWGDGFVPRMNGRSRPGIMRALGPSDLFTGEPPSIKSIIVDARLVAEDQDVSAELRDRGIATIVDTQAWRYSDIRTWNTAWSSTAYAPSSPFNAQRNWVRDYVIADLNAQFTMGGNCLLLPGWFPSPGNMTRAGDVASWILEAYEEFRRKTALVPAIAWLPSQPMTTDATLAAADVYADSGLVLAAYVQRQKIDGLRDPLDRLRRTIKLMLQVQSLGLPVIAGYLGCIGLAVRAIGVSAADCGPSEGHSFDFSEAIRTAIPNINESEAVRSGPPAVRMWLDELGQRVTARQMAAIRQDRVAFAEIICRRPCHRFRLGRETMPVAVQHSMLSLCETATRQSELPESMQVDNARRLLTGMKARIDLLNSALNAEKQPILRRDHLDVQLALLADADSLGADWSVPRDPAR
jgi:hypothetical protein